MERELAELRRRLSEGQEEQNLEDDMKKVLLCPVEQIKESAIQSKSRLTLTLEINIRASKCVLSNMVAGVSLKAQEDAEKLRSVVMPMEQEIAALKAKLVSAEDRVKELEASKVHQHKIS